MICRKACFKGWTHDEIVAGNAAEVEWKSTPETLQATLHATVSEAATPLTVPELIHLVSLIPKSVMLHFVISDALTGRFLQ